MPAGGFYERAGLEYGAVYDGAVGAYEAEFSNSHEATQCGSRAYERASSNRIVVTYRRVRPKDTYLPDSAESVYIGVCHDDAPILERSAWAHSRGRVYEPRKVEARGDHPLEHRQARVQMFVSDGHRKIDIIRVEPRAKFVCTTDDPFSHIEVVQVAYYGPTDICCQLRNKPAERRCADD